jgi:phenylacetate-CoA ligase
MAVIPVSGGMTDRQITLLQDFQSEVISCTPSYAQTLAEEFRKREIPLDKINLKHAILGAEPWTETIREEVEAGLGVTAVNIYGLSEIIGPGVSQESYQERGGGSTIWEDHFFPEVVNPKNGEPMPEGEDGVLVFTTLTKEALPLIRYWTNDITNIYYDSNSSRTHIKMGPIKGRADDMLIIRGVNLYPTQIEEVLKNLPEYSAHYQLVISKDGDLDALEVKVELSSKIYEELRITRLKDSDDQQFEYLINLKKKLIHKIKDNVGLTMKVTLQNYNEVPRSSGGKLSRVVDLRK